MYTDIILIVIGTALSTLLAYISWTLKKWRGEFKTFTEKVEEHEKIIYGGEQNWSKGLIDFIPEEETNHKGDD